MNAPAGLIRSIRFYFAGMVFFSVLSLLVVNYQLYQEGQAVQQHIHLEKQRQADQEMQRVLANSLSKLQANLLELAQWDEVYQQLHDPSYYFFWHDERMKESRLFHSSYAALELFTDQKVLLMPSSPTKGTQDILPNQLEGLKPYLVFKEFSPVYLNLFEPIYARGSRDIIGYVGVSVDLVDFLLRENNFYHVDKSTIRFNGSGKVPFSEVNRLVSYQAVRNPVSEQILTLLKNFTTEMVFALFLVAILFYLVFNVLIYSPIQKLSGYVTQLKNGEGFQPTKGRFFVQEFESLKHSIFQYHLQLTQTQQELDQQNQMVWEQARRDVLTNIYNRRAFDEAWNDVLYDFTKEPVEVVFVLFDCDFFKALNDTYGHEVGDEVIRLTAATIQETLPLKAPAYRIGGDEFAVIFQNRVLAEVEQIVAQCIVALSEINFSQLGVKETVTFSVGISRVEPGNHQDIASLPRQADIAMYKAKQSLQNKVQVYHQVLDKEAKSLVSNEVVKAVLQAVETGKGIEMNYQPIVCVESDQLYFESLVRLTSSTGDKIYPGDIFNVIERRRLEVEFDQQIIKKVVADLESGWIPKHSGVSINVSAKTLLQPKFVSLFDAMQGFLSDYKLVIEVTENSLVDHMEYAKDVLNELRAQGFKIALDDFGSGYSSIRYLAHMPVDIVKFDRSLVLALWDGDERTQNILESTAQMILDAGYQLVMEGIEDASMQRRTLEAGATHLQGYYFGKPNRQPVLPTQPPAEL